MIHPNEPGGNAGVTLNGRKMTAEEVRLIREALGIINVSQPTITVAATHDLPYGTPSRVEAIGTDVAQVLEFFIMQGKNGIDGHGSIESIETVSIPYGSEPAVINTGTSEIAKLTFYIPEGKPGEPGEQLPGGAVEDSFLGFKNGVKVWRPLSVIGSTGTGSGGTTTITTVMDTIAGLYSWESGTVVITPSQTIFDATTYAGYQSVVSAAALGSKRDAAATYLISVFGTAQKLTLKRNDVLVLVADYTGSLVKQVNDTQITVVLSNQTGVSSLGVADSMTGTWTMEITGGSGYARSMVFPATPDAATAAGQGFNPGPLTFVLPASLDGL